MQEKENIILDLTFEFALAIINYCEELELHRKYVISKQLLRSGTSIGANVREAQSRRVKLISFTKSKLPQKKPMKPNIGFRFA